MCLLWSRGSASAVILSGSTSAADGSKSGSASPSRWWTHTLAWASPSNFYGSQRTGTGVAGNAQCGRAEPAPTRSAIW